uniref:Uncharacterized protein n=1 Tax=Romanomermis culicivorax TaxID=13658 RepID=A0A915L3W6_ROMCU
MLIISSDEHKASSNASTDFTVNNSKKDFFAEISNFENSTDKNYASLNVRGKQTSLFDCTHNFVKLVKKPKRKTKCYGYYAKLYNFDKPISFGQESNKEKLK